MCSSPSVYIQCHVFVIWYMQSYVNHVIVTCVYVHTCLNAQWLVLVNTQVIDVNFALCSHSSKYSGTIGRPGNITNNIIQVKGEHGVPVRERRLCM